MSKYVDAIHFLRDEVLKTKCVLLGILVLWIPSRSVYIAYIPVADPSDGSEDPVGVMDRDPNRAAEMMLNIVSNPYTGG